MIALCAAPTKTGSTLCYRLVCALCEAHGHLQPELPTGVKKEGAVLNYVSDEMLLDLEWIERSREYIDSPQWTVIKTHAPCTPQLAELVKQGKISVIGSYRDPREVILSLKDAGRKAQEKGKGEFLPIISFHDAMKFHKKGVSKLREWIKAGGVCYDYYQFAFETVRFLQLLTGQLNLPELAAEELAAIADRVKAAGKTQLNLGRANRFLTDMSISQAAFFTRELHEEIQLYRDIEAPRSDDVIPQGFDEQLLAMADSLFTSPVTCRTFVVLGCPRGGTSLLAGALAAAGIHMGSYRTTQYEDPEFRLPPQESKFGDPERKLFPAILQRNRQHKYWGWKLPNNIYYIEQIRHLLINPTYLFIYRDPEAIARSSAKHDQRDWEVEGERLLQVARNHTQLVRDFEQRLKPEIDSWHTFRLEEIHAEPELFVSKLVEILKPFPANRESMQGFINPSGGYRELA